MHLRVLPCDAPLLSKALRRAGECAPECGGDNRHPVARCHVARGRSPKAGVPAPGFLTERGSTIAVTSVVAAAPSAAPVAPAQRPPARRPKIELTISPAFLVISDVLAIAAGFWLAYYVRFI